MGIFGIKGRVQSEIPDVLTAKLKFFASFISFKAIPLITRVLRAISSKS